VLSIEIRKADRRLEVACAGGARRSWPIALGRAPRGAKREAGDRRTPEGEYRISGAARRSRFHLFLPIDYPSRADAERALRESGLPPRDYQRIRDAHARGASPPPDTALGGSLGLHGEGARWRGDSADLDWTDGCIAMSDAEIEFLADRAPAGTPIRILP